MYLEDGQMSRLITDDGLELLNCDLSSLESGRDEISLLENCESFSVE